MRISVLVPTDGGGATYNGLKYNPEGGISDSRRRYLDIMIPAQDRRFWMGRMQD